MYKRDGVYVTDAVLSDSSAFYTPGVSEKRAGVTSYLHGGLKNQTRQANSSQNTTATRTYDAFGNVTSSIGTWNGPYGNGGAFGYQEDATGLKLLGHRYYDSSIGRFLTRDPIKDGRNWYAYCGNDPVNGVDPSGLTTATIGPGAVMTAALLAEIFCVGLAGGVFYGVSVAITGMVGAIAEGLRTTYPISPPITSDPTQAIPNEDTNPRFPISIARERTRRQTRGGYLLIGRVGRPGTYWAPEDPRTNPNWYIDYGMRTNPRDTPGDEVSGGAVSWDDYGKWILRPAQDYAGKPLNNGKYEVVFDKDYQVPVYMPWTMPWNPGFFRNH